jgi:hypothetical protein
MSCHQNLSAEIPGTRRAIPATKEALWKLAKEMMDLPDRWPYVMQNSAHINEGFLSVLSGKLRLSRIEEDPDTEDPDTEAPPKEVEVSQEAML